MTTYELYRISHYVFDFPLRYPIENQTFDCVIMYSKNETNVTLYFMLYTCIQNAKGKILSANYQIL